jgi:large subunit ribosomal protein L23
MVTEKDDRAQGEQENRYGFEVAKDSNKVQIKQAVEKEYNVTVTGVRTMIVTRQDPHALHQDQHPAGSHRSYKKAIVT